MKLSKLIEVWGILHEKDTGDLGFCDLADAIEEVDGLVNDVIPVADAIKEEE